MKSILSFVAGFVLAAVLFGFGVSFAQDAPSLPSGTAEYLKKAAAQIETLETIYIIARDAYRAGPGRGPDEASLKKARRQYDALSEDVTSHEPPLDLLGFHTQFNFAVGKCQNLLVNAEQARKTDRLDINFDTTRDFCAAQAQTAKLRLIDYGVAHEMAVTNSRGFGLVETKPYSVTEVITPTSAVTTATPLPPAEGEPIVNGVRWTIDNAEDLGQSLKLREQEHLQFETKGRFIVLHLTLENTGREPIEIGDGQYSQGFKAVLVDDQQRNFDAFRVGYSLEELCSSLKLNPGLPESCIVPFEVPQKAAGFKLRVTNQDNSDEIQAIELPFDLP